MFLIDGSNTLMRMLHQQPLWELSNKSGIRTGGVHGFINSLGSLCNRYKLQKGFVIAWDLGSSRYRRSLFPEYKEGRTNKDSPDYMEDLDPDSKEFIKCYLWSRSFLHKSFLPLTGSVSIQIEGVEADDIIGWICRNVSRSKKIVIVSSDKDFYQLVDDNVDLWRPVTSELITKESMIEDNDLIPDKYKEHLNLIKAMMGDSSDNIPGVRGLGWKRSHDIAKILLEDGEDHLTPESVSHKKYLENVDMIRKNLELVDLTVPIDQESEDSIRDHLRMSCSVGLPSYAEMSLHHKLKILDLSRSREILPDILQSNENSSFKSDILRYVEDYQ